MTCIRSALPGWNYCWLFLYHVTHTFFSCLNLVMCFLREALSAAVAIRQNQFCHCSKCNFPLSCAHTHTHMHTHTHQLGAASGADCTLASRRALQPLSV